MDISQTLNRLSVGQVKHTAWIVAVVLHFSEHEFRISFSNLDLCQLCALQVM